MKKTAIISFRIEEETKDALVEFAEVRGFSVGRVLRDLIQKAFREGEFH